MDAFEKEQVPKDMHVKAPQTLLQVAYVIKYFVAIMQLYGYNATV